MTYFYLCSLYYLRDQGIKKTIKRLKHYFAVSYKVQNREARKRACAETQEEKIKLGHWISWEVSYSVIDVWYCVSRDNFAQNNM